MFAVAFGELFLNGCRLPAGSSPAAFLDHFGLFEAVLIWTKFDFEKVSNSVNALISNAPGHISDSICFGLN